MLDAPVQRVEHRRGAAKSMSATTAAGYRDRRNLPHLKESGAAPVDETVSKGSHVEVLVKRASTGNARRRTDDDDDQLAGIFGRLASCSGPGGGPDEMPTSRPSSVAIWRAVAKASSLTRITSSYAGIEHARHETAPMPGSVRAARPPDSTGEASGSTATIFAALAS